MNNIYQYQFKVNKRILSFIPFLFGCMGLASIVVLDKFYWQTGLLEENLLNFSFGHLIRSLIIFISLSAIAWSLITKSHSYPILIEPITMTFE